MIEYLIIVFIISLIIFLIIRIRKIRTKLKEVNQIAKKKPIKVKSKIDEDVEDADREEPDEDEDEIEDEDEDEEERDSKKMKPKLKSNKIEAKVVTVKMLPNGLLEYTIVSNSELWNLGEMLEF